MTCNGQKHKKYKDNDNEVERFNKIRPKTHFSQHSDLQWSKTHKKTQQLKTTKFNLPRTFLQ